MFMFVFAVVLIALVSLFFQVIIALGAFLAAGQVGMGQQMMIWHSMAFRYACSAAAAGYAATLGSPPQDLNDPTNRTGIKSIQTQGGFGTATYTGHTWSSVIFRAQYQNADGILVPDIRVVATYILPNDQPSGYSLAAINKQLRRIAARDNDAFDFGLVEQPDRTARITTYETDTEAVPPVTNRTDRIIHNIPSFVLDNSVIMISDATC